MSPKFTDEELIEQLQEFAAELEDPPVAADVRDTDSLPSVQTYTRRFGSWNDAKEAAGLNAGPLTKADLVELIQNLAADLGRVPTIEDVNEADSYPHAWTFQNRFETWNKAVEAAGFEPNPGSPLEAPSKHDLAQAIVDLAERLDRLPTGTDMAEHGEFGTTVYQEQFGGWNDALAAAGIDRRGKSTLTRKELLSDLQEFANYASRGTTANLSRRKMEAAGPYSAKVYVDVFGSWPAALVAAGLPPDLRLSDAEIIDEIQAVAAELGREPHTDAPAPTVVQMQERGEISPAPIQHRFESWNEAVSEAGFVPNQTFREEYSNTYSDEELLEAIHEVAVETDGVPTADSVSRETGINPDTFRRRFGSWNRALELAGIPRNRASPGGVAYGQELAPTEHEVGGPVDLSLDTSAGPVNIRRGDIIADSYSPISPYIVLGFKIDEEQVPPEWVVVSTPIDPKLPHTRPIFADMIRDRLDSETLSIRWGDDRDRRELEAAADWSDRDEAILQKRQNGLNKTSAQYLCALESIAPQNGTVTEADVLSSNEDYSPDEITDWFDRWDRAVELADGVHSATWRTATESTPDAVESAEHSNPPSEYPEERLIEALQEAADELGQPLSSKLYDNWARGHPNRPIYQTINERLSWDEATDRAGVETPGKEAAPTGTDRRYSDSEIIDALQEAAAELGAPLRITEYNNWRRGKPNPTYSVVNRRFGSWKDGKDAAGIE